MSKNNNIEIFTAEYRHQVVEKFIRDLIDGYIKLPWPKTIDSSSDDALDRYVDKYITIKKNIEKYVSGKLESGEFDKVEASLFSEIVYFRILGVALDRKPEFNVREEIKNINEKIDTTNDLLLNVLVSVNELVKRLDK